MSGKVGFGSAVPEGDGKKPKKAAKPKKQATRAKNPHEKLLKPLTAREKKYIKGRAEGKTKQQSALDANYPPSVARDAGRWIERPHVQRAFQELMDRYIPDELIGQRMREGMSATQVKTASFNGEITDIQEFVDFEQRRKYAELAAEFKGRIRRQNGDVNVNLPVMLVHSIPRPDHGGGNGSGSVGS